MIVDHLCVNYGAKLFQELFLELQKKKIEQNVFYPRNTKHVLNISDQEFRVDSPLVLGMLTKVSLRWKRRIMKEAYDPLFTRNKPHLIHAHTLFSDGSLADYYFRNFGIPFIVAVRSTDLDVFLKIKPWVKRYGRKILDNAGYIIFISPALKNRFREIYGSDYDSKSLIIPNGINQNYLADREPGTGELHDPVELLYVGSFLKRKNVPALIELVEVLPAKLTIVGAGGKDEKKVRQMAQDSVKTTYLGAIREQSRLMEIYRNSDIFVMASQRETFGLVYIEAMSQGLPVIYSKRTGIDGLFGEGIVGYSVHPGSISEMQQAFDKICRNYQEISQSCIKEARGLNWTKLADQYYDIYNRIAGNESKTAPGEGDTNKSGFNEALH
jgi:glycosyltransferase involved in cell wall biosynthesis